MKVNPRQIRLRLLIIVLRLFRGLVAIARDLKRIQLCRTRCLKNIVVWCFVVTLVACRNEPKIQVIMSPKLEKAGREVMQLAADIMAIYQENNGVYWMGSWSSGLYRIDGSSIIQYTTEDGLPSMRIDEIKEDALGNVLIATAQGVVKWEQQGFTSIEVSSLVEKNWQSSTSDIWFKRGIEPGEVLCFDGQILHRMLMPKNELGEKFSKQLPAGAPSLYDVYCTYKDVNNRVWFGTAGLGAGVYDGRDFHWLQEIDLTELHDGPSNGIRSIVQDQNGRYWFNAAFTYEVAIDSIGIKYQRSPAFAADALGDNNQYNEFLSSVVDPSGRLWIATYKKGVYCFNGHELLNIPVTIDNQQIEIFCIYVDREGRVLIGTHAHGAFRWNGMAFTKF
jgi:ligand-binding sensor domain-containing protein